MAKKSLEPAFRKVGQIDPQPWRELEGIDFFLRNGLLFTLYEGKPHACLKEQPDPAALNAYARLPDPLPVLLLDEERYGLLKKRFKEIESDEPIGGIEGYEDEERIDEILQNGDLISGEESAPVIRYVNSLFLRAMKKRATDIHIESFAKEGTVRFRIDGVLNKVTTLNKSAVGAVINRIKVISNLDISETRLPQDGRTRVTVAGKGVDVRVSVVPTYNGEKVVLRLLMQEGAVPSLPELGFSDDVFGGLKSLLRRSYGMILITGPTGSGKSTTLHAFLREIDHDHFNIVTVEDPVEYNAEGINQIQVNEKIDLTFSNALRAILRQDPDIIMVGEMRDHETARIAVQAATTGHLLLSTLHTNSAVSAVTRLIDLGIPPYLISSTLIGIVAQRLVRLLCPHCKRETVPDDEDIRYFDLSENQRVYEAVGCERCDGTGYVGRRAVGEIILVDRAFAALIKEDVTEETLLAHLEQNGRFVPLFEKVRRMVVTGETSVVEAVRVGVKGV
ncbi:MAG: type II/IV secretion system protein [Epsilonproteobacteria bacterium]|nr:type II/IV secretion system protein [Campylobacterota bacterium]